MARRRSWANRGERSTDYTDLHRLHRFRSKQSKRDPRRSTTTLGAIIVPFSSRRHGDLCSPKTPDRRSRDGRWFRGGRRRHPIAGLEGNPVAVPATAKPVARGPFGSSSVSSSLVPGSRLFSSVCFLNLCNLWILLSFRVIRLNSCNLWTHLPPSRPRRSSRHCFNPQSRAWAGLGR